MENERILTRFSQQHQNAVQEIDQILLEKESPVQPTEQLLSVGNNYYPSAINVSLTGIKEFDELLDGGFTKGSIILLAGSSGSGKTIFSFQWLFEGVKNNENGIYITLTEPLFKTLENLEKLSYYDKDAIENEKLRIIDLREVYGKEGFDPRKILDFIENEVKRTNAKRLCIDSITAIAYQLDDRAKIRAFIFALGTTLATLGCTTVLTSEISEMNKYSKYEVEEFISDAILRFDQIKVKDEPQRIIQIIKVRGRNYRSDDIYFRITKDGIIVFPKLRVPLEHFSSAERISMGISALDDMLCGGVFVGSSTLIIGAPGTGKSTLGLSFIADGLKNGETCLYAGFEESKKQVLRNAKNFGWDFEKYERDGLLVMRCIYPNEKHIEEHLADIKRIVEGKKIKRCVVDPLSAISNAFSFDVFMSFSKRLNGYLKTREVTPLFASATSSLISNTKDVDAHLSTISDNIILLRYVEMQGNVQCVLNVIKMRGSEHSKNLRLYDITDKGIVVGKSLEGYEGITTGVSKKIAELEKESKELKEIIKQKETAENALRESEEKFRLLFNDAPAGIAFVDPDGIIKEANNSLLQLLSIRKEDFIGKNFVQLVHAFGLDKKENMADFSDRLAEKPSKREITFLNRNNHETTITVKSSIIKSGDEIIGLLYIIDDITEHKEAEEKIRMGENRYRYTLEITGQLGWTTNADGEVLEDFPEWRKYTGQKKEEVKAWGWLAAIHPDDVEHTVEIWKNAVATKSNYETEFRVRRHDGIYRLFLARGVPILNKDGSVQEWIGTCIDITERKIKEEKLRQLAEIVESSDDAIISKTLDGTILSWNKGAEKLYGYTAEEVKGRSINLIVPPDNTNDISYLLEKIKRGEPTSRYETVRITKDKRLIAISLSIAPVKDTAGKLVGATTIAHDITERKQVEDKIKYQNVQLEKLNQIKSDFFDVTSREIRSPLTTIKAYTQMLSNRLFGEITEEQKKYLETMLRNANRLDNLVSGLLDISHLESGNMVFTTKKTIVSKMLNEAVEKMQSSANAKNIAINVEMEEAIPDLIVDQDRIKQVIINILENAIKFSPDKSTVILRVKKQGTDVLFEIQDSGKGISKDKQNKIFNAFYRADEGKSREFSGGGIGLALSRGIITVHGGKIWVESEDDKGSTFRFTLPIKPVDNIQSKYSEVDTFRLKQDKDAAEIK